MAVVWHIIFNEFKLFKNVYILLIYKLFHNERDDLMIKRESMQKKLLITVVAGMLMLLLAASCAAQTPLKMSGSENCTNCSANASSSSGLDDAAQETVSTNSSVGQGLEPPITCIAFQHSECGHPTYIWNDVDGCQYYCLEVGG